MEQIKLTKSELSEHVGAELGVTEWIPVEQERIATFADCTDDHQWIHVDEARSEAESPYGTTIAHGFLTLSLLTKFHLALGVYPEDAQQVLNYGMNKVRFLNPVKQGDQIRNRVVLKAVEEKGHGAQLATLTNTIEINGVEKPAMIAEMLVLLI